MKISWNWLKRHADLDGVNPYDMANRFTMAVAELEGIHEFGETYDRVLTARILGSRPHPNSQRLALVDLDLGNGRTVTAVSGAPNLTPGLVIPFAQPGVVLEGIEGKPTVKEADVKGIVSPGITCSELELGISQDHTGLLEFPPETPVGVPLTDVLPVHDYILEIDNKSITHRPDLWGHRGLAREVAALAGRRLLPVDTTIPEGTEDPLAVRVDAPDLCPRYCALAFDGVKVAGSPLWLKLALSRVGVRPISNVVDATNFAMLDVGNPLHAFDARFIEQDTIVVRRALPDEILVTLDGWERHLLPDDLVIADGAKGVALAGVMGGENSEIKDDTTRVVLEAACFNASAIRRTSSRLQLRTEASARFEKGLDMKLALDVTALFVRLMAEVAPGCRVASRLYNVSVPEPAATVIRLAPEFVRRKLGADIPDSAMKAMLEGIEFQVDERGDEFHITVPSFRATRDIRIPEDIVEEIGRIYGYDNIDPVPLLAPVTPPPVVLSRQLDSLVRQSLVTSGYNEVMTYSFASSALAETLGVSLQGAVELANPISSDLPVLRQSLIPNLLGLAAKNGLLRDDFRLFEVGRVFFAAPQTGQIPVQQRRVAGILYSRNGDNFELYRNVRSHVESLFHRLGRGEAVLVEAGSEWKAPWVVLDKARCILLRTRADGAQGVPDTRPVKMPDGDWWLLDGESADPVGIVGMLSPVVRDRLKLRGKAVFFEINLEPVFTAAEVVRKFKPLPRFPAIQNDLSVLVDMAVPYERVAGAIRESGGTLLDEMDLFAIFRGGPIPEGKKSLSFHLRFRSTERTLQDQEVEPVVKGILAALREKVGGEIRE